MLLRTEKFLREFSNWNHIECIWIDRVLPRLWGRKYLQEKFLLFCKKEKKIVVFAPSFGIVEQEWLRPTYMSKEVWLCSAPGTIWSPSTPGATLPKWDGLWNAKISNCQNRQQPHLPTTRSHQTPTAKITKITIHQDHEVLRSPNTNIHSNQISKHQDHQGFHLT